MATRWRSGRRRTCWAESGGHSGGNSLTQRIVVFGATGDQGRAQVEALARAGQHPVAVNRSGRSAPVDGIGVEAVAADLSDAAAIEAAVQGADAIFLNLPSTSFQAAEPLIAATASIAMAAEQAGVGVIVFNTSLPVPDDKRGFAAQDARHDMRAILFAGQVPAISIEPVVFLDNLLKGWAWPSIAQRGVLAYPHRAGLEVSWICHADLAQLMIAASRRPDFSGRHFAVGGAQTVRLEQLAAILSQAWGVELAVENQTIDAFVGNMGAVFEGRSSLDAQRMMAELKRIYEWYNHAPETPFKVDMTEVLKVLPVTLTPIADWARAQRLPTPICG